MSSPFPKFDIRKTARRLSLATLLASFLLGILGAQTIETERWPVPMRVDHEQIPTGMLVEMNFERLETPATEFDAQGDPDRQVINSFVQSILTKDIDQAIDLTIEAPGTVPENARELLTAFSDLLDGRSESLQLDRIVHQGSDRLLVWSIPTEDNKRFYRSFRFVRNENEQLAYEGLLTEPVSSLLTNVFQVDQETGPVSDAAGALKFEYELPNTESSPVKMLFNGESFDVDALSPGGSTQNRIVDFYNASMQTLATGSPEQLAAYYTPYSRQRYAQWAVDQGDLAYESFRSDMIEYGSRVVFVLDAAPMHLVFFLPGNVDVQGDPLRFATIYDDPQNGLQLANFYIEGLTQTLIKQRQYFEEPFLRPYLANAGVISRERQRERTIASNGETELPDPYELDAVTDAILASQEPDPKPGFSDIEDIANSDPIWPWILGILVILALAALILSKRNRNKK